MYIHPVVSSYRNKPKAEGKAMKKEPTKAEMNAKQAMMEWKARNRKFRQDIAAKKAKERAAESAAKRAQAQVEDDELE